MRQPDSPRTNGICSPSTAASADALPSRAWKRAKMKSSMTASDAGSSARKIHDPVGLPIPAAVGREGLLPAATVRFDGRPDEAHTDRLALEAVVREEGADAVLEAAYQGRIERRGIAAVEPVDPPGPDLGIVGA